MDRRARPPDSPATRSPGTECPSRETLEVAATDIGLERSVEAHLGACARCRAVVDDARRDNEFLAQAAAVRRAGSTAPGSSTVRHPGIWREAAVPGYDLHGELHRGAQGVVHEATQRSTHRRVALKVMLRGRFATSSERRRFEREIDVVAGLRHPGIVTLFDSGATPDGAAYFAMELVDGVRFDEWLAARPRSLAQRLRVLRAIADAVAHAHQRGVIHRDLKPGNVLVASDDTPRVLDFGLARWRHDAAPGRPGPHGLGGDATIDGGFAGTFAYAAPEQLTGPADQIDVRADVYALGLLLHEALAGERAFGAAEPPAAAIARRLAGPAPDAPLRRARVDDDLRAIVQHATAPDPARRYQSAAALVQDLDRHAAGRPVSARGDGTLYVLRRFAARHRVAVAAAGAAGLVVLGALAVAAILFQQRGVQQGRAQRALEALRETLVAMSQERPGGDAGGARRAPATASEFFAVVAERVDKLLGDDPASRAMVHATLGEIDVNLANLDGAERHLRAVLTDLDDRDAEDRPAIATALHNLARVHFFRGELREAETLYADALARREALFGRRSPEVALTLTHLASCRRRLGDREGAEVLSREVLAIRQSLGGPTPEEFAAAINNLGSLRLEAGDADEAAELFESSRDMISGALGPDDWRVAHALRNLGAARLAQGRVDEASQAFLRATEILDRHDDRSHPRRPAAHVDLARARLAAGDAGHAARIVNEIAPLCSESVQHHQEFSESLARFAAACEEAGRSDLAEALSAGPPPAP